MERLTSIETRDKITKIYNEVEKLGGSHTEAVTVSLEEETQEVSNSNLLVLIKEIAYNIQLQPSALDTENDLDKIGLHAEIIKMRSTLKDGMNEFLDNDILDILEPGDLAIIRPKLYKLFDLVRLNQSEIDKVKADLDEFIMIHKPNVSEYLAYSQYFDWLIEQYGKDEKATLQLVYLVWKKCVQAYARQFKSIIPLLFDIYDEETIDERLELYITFVYNFSVNYKNLRYFSI